MVKPIDTAERVRYVAKCDRDLPPDQQTTWILRQLTAREQAHIDNRDSGWESRDGVISRVVREGEALYWPGRLALCGVENYAVRWTESRNQVDASAPGIASDDFFNSIPRTVRHELTQEARSMMTLTEADVGESKPPRTSTGEAPQATAQSAGGEAVEA